MIDTMLPLPGLSPVSVKTVIAKFDGGVLPSDGGVLLLREVEQAFVLLNPSRPALRTRVPPSRSHIALPTSSACVCW